MGVLMSSGMGECVLWVEENRKMLLARNQTLISLVGGESLSFLWYLALSSSLAREVLSQSALNVACIRRWRMSFVSINSSVALATNNEHIYSPWWTLFWFRITFVNHFGEHFASKLWCSQYDCRSCGIRGQKHIYVGVWFRFALCMPCWPPSCGEHIHSSTSIYQRNSHIHKYCCGTANTSLLLLSSFGGMCDVRAFGAFYEFPSANLLVLEHFEHSINVFVVHYNSVCGLRDGVGRKPNQMS